MTEQQTPDREKKIAEIREALEKIDRGDLFEIAMAYEKSGEWLRFLLDELERMDEENRKLREERDAAVEGYQQQVEYAGELMTKLVSAQQEMNNEIQRLRAALEEVRECLDDFWDHGTPRRLYKEVRRFAGQLCVMEKVINQAISTATEPTNEGRGKG